MLLLIPGFSLLHGPLDRRTKLLAVQYALLPDVIAEVSVLDLAPSIFGEQWLNRYAMTRFLKDGCF